MDCETLVERAHKLIPILRERAPECDALGHLPDETREALRDSGIARILQPRAYGGAEASLSRMVEILTAIGSGCGSTAWCLAQYIGHNFMVAQWPHEGQEDVWGEDPQSLVAGILIPHLGKVTAEDGGYRITGQWPFVSGVLSCDWLILSGLVDRPGSEPEERYFLVRRGDFEVLETWDSVGLRGSGSHDVRVEGLYVPAHRTLPIAHLKGGESPGRARHRGVLYRSPSYMTFGILISSASVGMADGIVRDYLEHARTRVALMSGQAHLDQPMQHVRLSKATLYVDAAKAVLHRNCDEIMEILEADRSPTDEERTKFRAAGAMAGDLAFQAANLVWDAEGGRGVYMSNPVARTYRDLCTSTRHMTHSWDLNGSAHGRVRLGLPLDNPSL